MTRLSPTYTRAGPGTWVPAACWYPAAGGQDEEEATQ
jgi:hypothetical protein